MGSKFSDTFRVPSSNYLIDLSVHIHFKIIEIGSQHIDGKLGESTLCVNICRCVEFSIPQQSILNVITKQTILSITVIMSCQIYLLTNIFMTVFIEHKDPKSYEMVVVFNVTLFALDCVLNCLCILLSFIFQQRCYSKICGKCDSCLQSVCIRYVQRRLRYTYKKVHEDTLLLETMDDAQESIELSKSKSRR